jgi:hypothetical protein
MSDVYNIIISPENIQGDLFKVNYRGIEVGVYSGMSQVLSAGPNGSSLLTGLTIPILITQTAVDVGYYSPFDGAVLQKDVVANFIFSSTTTSPYVYYVYNTSNQFQKFLELSVYTVDWGDGSPLQVINNFTPNFLSHTYPTASANYTITLQQTNPWGQTMVKKEITSPFTNIIAPNPNGTAFFIPQGGSWANTPISYDYIFSGDAVNTVAAQTSNNYLTVPFQISGISKSRLTELQLYGPNQYELFTPVIANGQIWGNIFVTASTYTGYTIQGINYYDYIDGTTNYFQDSSGFTNQNLTAEPITKNETLIKAVDQPQIQTDVFVERGKNSAYERVQRLGEVDNIGDMINYGYGFFNVEEKASAI